MENKCFVSWSGGKDSCFALYKAIKNGYKSEVLLTMFSMENGISSAHRLSEDIFRAQSEAIGITHIIGKALFNDYEEVFVKHLKMFKEQGIDFGVFGDIDLEEHREWEERVCGRADIKPVLPLWLGKRRDIVEEFVDAGFKAKIIVVNKTKMSSKYLGKDLSKELIKELENDGVDACGENGEFHTIVYDGPIFKKPLELQYSEVIDINETYAQLEVSKI